MSVVTIKDDFNSNNTLSGLRLHRQISKSVERASEIDSMINEEEECEIDLMSNSDYAIGTVSENILRKRGDEFNINRASSTF